MRLLLVFAFFALLQSAPVRAGDLDADLAYIRGDYATALQTWSAAAGAGDASAMSALGTLYDTGHGVEQDFAVALRWYRRAAEAGSVRGMFNVGAMYDNGRGTAEDRAEAIRWYKMAAARGHGRAAFALGLIFRDGDGVPRDRTAAIKYFRAALAGGIEAARTNLVALGSPPAGSPAANATIRSHGAKTAAVGTAVLSRTPLGTVAAREFTIHMAGLPAQAADDDRMAQYELGYAYEHGYGRKTDPVKAYIYYLRASSATDTNIKTAALRGAEEVGRGLTDDQHGQSRDMLLDGRR